MEKKRGRKPGAQLIKNLQNSIKKQGEKSIIDYFVYFCIGYKKAPKPSQENGKKNLILIEDRNKIFECSKKQNLQP